MMKKILISMIVLILLGISARGAGTYGPTVFYGDVSVGTYLAVTNIVGCSVTNTTSGHWTNGNYSLYYRINGTNYKGRLPVSGVTNIAFTGSVTGTNLIDVTWKYVDGVIKHIVERSEDGINFTNWVAVGSTVTNYYDYGTNSWTNSVFTGLYGVIPAPNVPWIGSALFSGQDTTGVVTSAGGDAGKYLKADGSWATPAGGNVYLEGTNHFTSTNWFDGEVYSTTGVFKNILTVRGSNVLADASLFQTNGTYVSAETDPIFRGWSNQTSGISAGGGSIATGDGVAMGYNANGYNSGSAFGHAAIARDGGVAMGSPANGSNYGTSVGWNTLATNAGVAVGYSSRGYTYGVGVGPQASGYNHGIALGYTAEGRDTGVSIGEQTKGYDYGTAVGPFAYGANKHNVAAGYYANAMGAGGNFTNTTEIGVGTATNQNWFHYRGVAVIDHLGLIHAGSISGTVDSATVALTAGTASNITATLSNALAVSIFNKATNADYSAVANTSSNITVTLSNALAVSVFNRATNADYATVAGTATNLAAAYPMDSVTGTPNSVYYTDGNGAMQKVGIHLGLVNRFLRANGTNVAPDWCPYATLVFSLTVPNALTSTVLNSSAHVYWATNADYATVSLTAGTASNLTATLSNALVTTKISASTNADYATVSLWSGSSSNLSDTLSNALVSTKISAATNSDYATVSLWSGSSSNLSATLSNAIVTTKINISTNADYLSNASSNYFRAFNNGTNEEGVLSINYRVFTNAIPATNDIIYSPSAPYALTITNLEWWGQKAEAPTGFVMTANFATRPNAWDTVVFTNITFNGSAVSNKVVTIAIAKGTRISFLPCQSTNTQMNFMWTRP